MKIESGLQGDAAGTGLCGVISGTPGEISASKILLLLASNDWILLIHKDFDSMMNMQAECVYMSLLGEISHGQIYAEVYILSVALMGRER